MDLSTSDSIFPLVLSILANKKLSNSVSTPSTLIVPVMRAASWSPSRRNSCLGKWSSAAVPQWELVSRLQAQAYTTG